MLESTDTSRSRLPYQRPTLVSKGDLATLIGTDDMPYQVTRTRRPAMRGIRLGAALLALIGLAP